MDNEYASDLCYLVKDIRDSFKENVYSIGNTTDINGIEERLDKLIEVLAGIGETLKCR